MANGYVVLNDGMVVIAKWVGHIPVEELIAHERKRSADSSIKSGAVMLMEARSAVFETTQESACELSELITQSSRQKRISKYAMLVSDEEYQIAKAHERENLTRCLNTIVFSSLTVACKWLGIDFDQARQSMEAMKLE